MIPIIEDYLSELLEEKFQLLRDNPSLIDKIMNTSTIKKERLKEVLKRQPVKILKGYPRTGTQVPCVCILLSKEEETQEGLGDYNDDDYIMNEYGDTPITQENIVSMYDFNYRLECWANNGDLVVELYHLTKWAVLSSRGKLIEDCQLYRQKLGGADFEPAPSFFPDFVYRRALTFWCQSTISVPIHDDIEIGQEVTGVIVSQSINQQYQGGI